jgi:hypothetical protein
MNVLIVIPKVVASFDPAFALIVILERVSKVSIKFLKGRTTSMAPMELSTFQVRDVGEVNTWSFANTSKAPAIYG